jgi:tetratricopeptide (TPR) repeat protein
MACTGGKCLLTSKVRKLRETGMEAMASGDLHQAEELLRRSVALAETDAGLDVVTANSAYRLALALHQSGQHDEAAQQFEKALTLARGRAGCGSKLYKTILGHFAEALPARAYPDQACAVGE